MRRHPKKRRQHTKKLKTAVDLAIRLWDIDPKKWGQSNRTNDSLFKSLEARGFFFNGESWENSPPPWAQDFI